jgi:hypothetical protein
VGVVLALQGVVVSFQFVELRQIATHVEELAHDGVFLIVVGDGDFGSKFGDGSEDLHEQYTVVGDDGAAAFTDDSGVGYGFGVAYLTRVVDDVVSVFLQRVVGGAVEG